MHQLPSERLVTLGEVWRDYQQTRKLKPETLRGYTVVINRCFPDWLPLPIHMISRDMIEGRHRYMSSLPGRWTGAAQANLAMRVLRALITFAGYKYDQLGELTTKNPVKRLTEVRAWNKVGRRRTHIARQLQPWFEALRLLPYRTNRDFHIALLFTGCRKNELASLPWRCVDFANETLLVEDTKNGFSLELPMSSHLTSLLLARKRLPDCDPKYVFTFAPYTPLSEDYRGYEAMVRASGITFTFHDLRRSFATIADDLDISERVIKRLLNHRTGDVTSGYICSGSERLRRPAQLINDEMLRRAGHADLGEFV